MTMQNLILILAVISSAPLDAFDLFKKDHLIPSDGFHDVLGLVPFWLSESFPDNGLRRTLGTKRDNLPTSWETFTSESTGTKTYSIQGRCSLEGKFSTEKTVLVTKKGDNCENPSLKMVFDKIFPSIDVMRTTQQLINPDSFFFEKLEINIGSKEVTVEAKAKDSWRLLSGDNFVLGGASLILGFKAGEPVDGIKSWKIKAEGTVGVSAHSLKMVIDKPRNKASLPFQWKIDSLLMVDLMGIFGITMSQLNFLAIGFDTSKLEGLTFESPDCNGQIDFVQDTTQRSSETFQIVCKASISNSAAFRTGDVYLIMTRAAGQVVRPAIVIDVADTINIQETLENFISEGSFISDFAMLGRIERNCIIMIAKDTIVMVENKKLMESIKPFITEFDTTMIPKGINVRVMIPLKANMQSQKDCKENLPAEVPEQLAVTIEITAGGLSFSFPEQFKSDMPKFLKCLDPQIKAELPRQLFPPTAGPIDIKEITIGQGRFFKITVVLKGPFVFMGGKIKVDDLEVTITKQKGEDLQFAGVTTITVGKLAVGLTLEKQGSKYALSAYVKTFKLDQLQEMIGPNTLPDFISLLGNLKDFGIKDFKLVKTFGKGDEHKSLRIAGRPILWGWENSYIEGLIWKPRKGTDQPATAVAVGIIIEGVRLDKLMERIFGSKLFSVAWFSEMTALIIVSNANGKVESSSDRKVNANNVGEAQRGKSDSKSSASGRRFDVSEAHEFYSTFERRKRDLRSHFAYLHNTRKFQKQRKQASPYFEPHRSELYGRNHVYGKNLGLGVKKRTLRKRAQTKPKSESKSKDVSKNSDEKEEEEEEEDVVKFSVPYLSSRDIEKGSTFVGIFNIPQDNGCFGDSICLWLAEKIGKDATIEISGTLSKSGFKLGATLSGTIPVNTDGTLALQKIALQLELSNRNSSVKLECTLYWNIPQHLGSGQVQFIGAIETCLDGKLSLEFAMAGTWRNPFKFKYLALANLNLAMGVSVGAGGVLPTFQFGGTVLVGVIDAGSNDHAIKFSIYFGIDFNNPDDNYIFGSVNKFTLSQIFKAFKLGKPKVPRVVAESGFPEGLTVSYSMKGKTIEALDLNIEKGLYLKGTISFLGFKVAAEILINPPEKLLIDVELSPIDWAGGLITLRRNVTDRVKGPKAFIYLKPDSVTVQIEGYISILGNSNYVYIDVSDTGFKFQMTTDIWGMIRSDLVVQAAYGNLAALHFSFVASVKIDFHLRQIADAAMKYLNKAKDIAVKKLEEAQRRVADAQKKVENAGKKMDGWKKSIDDYQNRLKKRSEEIENAKKEFAKSCQKECGDVCVPFLEWKSKCLKVGWWWVGCSTWNTCKWKAPNVICIAACEIKKTAKKFVAWAEQTGIKILIGLSEIGKGLIDVGKGFVTMAKHLVGLASDLLKFVQDVVKVGIEISKNIMNWVGDNLFKVELLELRGKLTGDFNACVGITCKFVILGLKADYTGDLCVNLKFWENFAADTVEDKYKGTKKMIQKVPNIDGKAREFASNKGDLDKKEEDIEKDVKKETKDRRKRDYVPTAEEMYYRRLAEEPLPAIVTRSASTVNAFKNGAPWVLVEDYDNRNFDHTPLEDSNIPAEKRTLYEDWHKHHTNPCLQISKVIDKYSMIADGLRSLHDAMINVREGYQATKRTMQQGVDDLRREIKSTEMRHNMTHEEQEDLYHWYNKAKDGTKKWNSKARRLLADEHNLMLPRFRSQIEHILKKEYNKNFLGYMNELHEVGQAAFKRSNIPSESSVTNAKELHRIKRDLIGLVHSDETNQLRFGAKVRSIQTNIRGLKRSTERCN